ncbi:MAG: hypothetical protein JNM17_24175 [Archangium sp.]|nr:hypothetical protein [Archangium sp.]
MSSTLDLLHLRRSARTALELGVVALAPPDLLDELAATTGLLEAVSELPADSPPVIALVPRLTTRATAALKRWDEWYGRHLARIKG